MKKRVKDVRDRFDAMMEIIIKVLGETRSKLQRKDAAKDVLDALLSIYEDHSSEVKITRDNIKAFLVVIIFSLCTNITYTKVLLYNMIVKRKVLNCGRNHGSCFYIESWSIDSNMVLNYSCDCVLNFYIVEKHGLCCHNF